MGRGTTTPILVLMRHGVAEGHAPGGDDGARALTPGGAADAARAASGLVVLGIHPDVVVTSPLLRCRQTAALVADAAGCPLEEDIRLAPGMTCDDVLGVVADHPEARTILACSHQPGLTHALADLTACGAIGFRRPQAAVVSLETPRPGGGSLIAVLPPRILRAAAAGTSSTPPRAPRATGSGSD